MTSRFRDRIDAGRRLAAELRAYADDPDVRILALPRGGVPVGYEVARALRAPLDVFLVRKLGLPQHPELAMGAIASGDTMVLDDALVRRARVTDAQVRAVVDRERRELERRERRYRGDRPPPDIAGRTVILVDDGLATGATMRAAVQAVRQREPGRVVVAVPIASPEACEAFREVTDDTVCAVTPEPFYAVGLWYEDFSQTSDEEVHELLEDARMLALPPGPASPPARDGAAERGAR
jgi:predicted phosphoribosyltransferase